MGAGVSRRVAGDPALAFPGGGLEHDHPDAPILDGERGEGTAGGLGGRGAGDDPQHPHPAAKVAAE